MNPWQAFFDHHAVVNLQNVFTRNTLAAVDFLLERLQLPAGSALLDLGCGVGRHSVELARRGDRVTGVVVREQPHLPQDLARLCRAAGFSGQRVWGGTAGAWGRRPVARDDIEVMIVAGRP